MDENDIIRRLLELGFARVGKPGWRSRFTQNSTGKTLSMPESERLQSLGKCSRGSVYIHEPGVIVATGDYQEWLSQLRPANGIVGHRERPGWYDAPGEPAATELLNAIEATTR